MIPEENSTNTPQIQSLEFKGKSYPFLVRAEASPKPPQSPEELVEEGELTARNPWVSPAFYVETHYFDITPGENCFEARYDTPNELRIFCCGKAGVKYLVEIEVECLQVNSYTQKATMRINDVISHDFTLQERHTMSFIQQTPEDGHYRIRLKESTVTGGDYRARWKVHHIRISKIG